MESEREEPKRVPMGAYIDRSQHELLAEIARENERSLSAEVRLALREHIEREQREPEPAR
jgi:hypothetical protein